MYTLAKHLTTQNLTSNCLVWLIWNISTFVISTNLHQNDLKINIFVVFLFVLESRLFTEMLFSNYSAPINMINSISLSLHSRCNKV